MRIPDEAVDHPKHYGGKSNPYEAIKVIEAWKLGFSLGNAVKYISRAGKKGDRIEDLKKARWYLDREIQSAQTAEEKMPCQNSQKKPSKSWIMALFGWLTSWGATSQSSELRGYHMTLHGAQEKMMDQTRG